MYKKIIDLLQFPLHPDFSKIDVQLIELLKQANNSFDLKAALLSDLSSTPGTRLIDTLFLSTSSKMNELFKKIIENLSVDDWDAVLKFKTASANQNIIETWLKNDCKPSSAIDFIFYNNSLNFNQKMEILTLSTKRDTTSSISHSILTHHSVPLSKKIDMLKQFDDLQKEALMMAFEGGSNNDNLLLIAASNNQLDTLLAVITDKKISNKLKDYVSKYYLRKKGTHFLGIKDTSRTFNFQTNQHSNDANNSIAFKGSATFEGITAKPGFEAFKNVFLRYTPSSEFTKIFEEIKTAISYIIDPSPSPTNNSLLYYKEYSSNKLVIIPSGWPGHSITLAASKDFLICANRGQGLKSEGGCIIYKLKAPLTQSDIDIFTEQKSQAIVQQRLTAIVETDIGGKPLIFCALPLKPQKYGTCSIANKKGIIAGLLALLKHFSVLNDPSDRLTKIDSSTLLEARVEYKKFTEHTRMLVLNEILSELKSNQLNAHELIEALSDFCNQHLDLNKLSETKLLHQLINKIPPSFIDVFLNKLTPQARCIVSYFKRHSFNPPFPEILKKTNAFSQSVPKIQQPDFFKSLSLLLDDKFSEEESYKWCNDYFFLLTSLSLYDVISQNVQNLSSKKIYNIFSQDANKKIKNILTHLQWPGLNSNIQEASFCLKQVFEKLDPSQKASILTPEVLKLIADKPLLESALKNLSVKQIFKLFNKVDSTTEPAFSPLQGEHTLEFLKHLADLLGDDRFSSLLMFEAQSGRQISILDSYINNPKAFQFLVNKLSKRVLSKHIDNFKLNSQNENLIFKMVKSVGHFSSAEPESKNRFECLQYLATKFTKEEMRTWLLEKNTLRHSIFEYALKNEDVFLFICQHFDSKELLKIIIDANLVVAAIEENSPGFKKFISVLNDDEFRDLISIGLDKNIYCCLVHNHDALDRILKTASTNEITTIFNQYYEEFITVAILQFNMDILSLVRLHTTIPEIEEKIHIALSEKILEIIQGSSNNYGLLSKIFTLMKNEDFPNVLKKLHTMTPSLSVALNALKDPYLSEVLSQFEKIPDNQKELLFNTDMVKAMFTRKNELVFAKSNLLNGFSSKERTAILAAAELSDYSLEILENYYKSLNAEYIRQLLVKVIIASPSEKKNIEASLEFIVNTLNPSQKEKYLTATILQYIHSGALLKIATKELTDLQIIKLFNQTDRMGCPPLYRAHDMDFLESLNNIIGKPAFVNLLEFNNIKTGNKCTILGQYQNDSASFGYLLTHLSDEQLKNHINNQKNVDVNHNENLFCNILANVTDLNSAPSNEKRFENLKELAKRFSPKEIRAWLIEENGHGESALELAMIDKEVFSFFYKFVDLQDLAAMILRKNFSESKQLMSRLYHLLDNSEFLKLCQMTAGVKKSSHPTFSHFKENKTSTSLTLIEQTVSAISNSNFSQAQQLIEKLPNINQANSFGSTPLIAAVISNHYDIAKLLIAKGADPFQKNPRGLSAIDYIVSGQRGAKMRSLLEGTKLRAKK